MAPMKRHRDLVDDCATETIEAESASSNLKPASRKKPRVSCDDPEDSLSDLASDEDNFLEQATQFATQQKSKTQVQNEAADNGIIESVTCTNFMCHAHLEITLGPLINFIIGHNGSGKSAVLTALTICLGGKASSTNRGQSLKSFIKEGQESAMLSVKIKNTGESAYQQATYGDSIIVERHFSRSGSSAFKLKSSSGRLISNRKGDLEEICDYFALQIDNPMNVLTQDMARQFLNNSSPQEKYKFFMKGTQLEHLDGDYLIVEQNLDAIDTELCKKLQDCEIFTERAEKAKELLALSEQQDILRDKIEDYRGQLAWVQVEKVEAHLADLDRDLLEGDEKIGRLEMNANGLSESFTQTEQILENANRALEDSNRALTPLTLQKATEKEEQDRLKAEQMNLQTEERQIADEVRAAGERITTVRREIEAEHHRLSEADGGRNASRRREIDKRKEDAAQAKTNLKEHENELPGLEANKARAENEKIDADENLRKQKQSVEEAWQNLDVLLRDRGQQQSAFPANLPRLLKAIEEDNGFRQKPVGPLGRHVRLTKPAWSSILEKSFGQSLDSFIVTSKEDQIRLSSLMQRINCTTPILISRSNSIDTQAYEPDRDLETSLKVLEFDDDLARNSLIIGQGIDQTVLIAEREEAIALMNGPRPVNVKQCFSHNQKYGTGIRFGFGFGGGLSEGYVPEYKGTPRMKTDVEFRINSQKEVLQDLTCELRTLEQRQCQQRDHLLKCEQAIKKHKLVARNKVVEMQQAQNLVEELQDALDQDESEPGRLDSLGRQLTDAEDDKTTYENTYEELVIAKDATFASLRENRDHMTKIDDQIKEVEARIHKAEMKASHRENERRDALREKNAALEALEMARITKVTRLEARQAQLEIVESFIEEATQVCARVPVNEGENEESLHRKHEKLRRDLANAETRTGNRGDIARNAYKAVEAMKQAREELEGVERLAQLLKTTLVNRKERWKLFQKLITARARIQFFFLLSERGFRGRLIAGHKLKSLDLNVEPDETKRNGNGRTTHGLSGGEKSFSTICLLLSMWEAMGAPIRCLDEFDVFMDSVNREVSMNMMIQFARNSPGKQFILISPQSTNKNLPDRDVKLIKMQDPERGQQTLNFAIAA